MGQDQPEAQEGAVAREGQAFREELERVKAASLLQVLFKTARLTHEYALEGLRAQLDEEGLRASHMALFPHIDLEGTRLTVIAERLGVSKQAAGQLVGELVGMGLLERVPDPSDGRAKLVRFGQAPGRSLLDGMAYLVALEEELGARFGDAWIASLHKQLTELLLEIERRSDTSTPACGAPDADG